MAIVPFRVSGAAADQSAELRVLQIGNFNLELSQDPSKSGSVRNNSGLRTQGIIDHHKSDGPANLENVGLVVWQSGFLLADYLLRHPPFGDWPGVNVVDLGTGTGVVGIALAMAGATVTLADLPHINPLALQNVARNQLTDRCQVVSHHWGDQLWQMDCQPDIVTGGDLLYEPDSYDQLLGTLEDLAGPHTLVYLSFRSRSKEDMGFKALLEARGFLVRDIDSSCFNPEYRQEICRPAEGEPAPCSYHILAAQKLG